MGKRRQQPHKPIKKEERTKIQQLIEPNIKLQHGAQKEEVKAPTKPITKKSTKKNRMIVRNLVFDINEKHLKKLFTPFGEVAEITIPKHPDRGCSRGFAFVEMSNKNHCLKAIRKLNNSLFKGRKIIIDMSVAKENFMNEKFKDQENNNQEKEKMEEVQGVKEQEANEEEDVQEQGQEEVEEEEQEQEEEEDHDDIKDEEERVEEDHRSEIFIRNLPISATEEQLLKMFRKYGKIKFVKLVMNKETNTSRGTAFIKYYDAGVAEKLIEYSRSYEMYLLKKNPKFTPDPSIHLNIDGSIAKIFPVETRSKIQEKLKDREDGVDNSKKKPVKKIKKIEDLVKADLHDKRRVSLALLGRWRSEEGMSKYDYERFKAHEKEKVEKLKNPNHSVSPTRIVLKHLDKAISEEQIRSYCSNFLRERNLNENHLTYCKLMLDSSMKKSAGFAFIELRKHEEAKSLLEQISQNPKNFMERPFIAEFAIQDSRKLLKLKRGKEGEKKEKKEKKEKEGNRNHKGNKSNGKDKKGHKSKPISKDRLKKRNNGAKKGHQ